jgi:acyl-CoA thioesterase
MSAPPAPAGELFADPVPDGDGWAASFDQGWNSIGVLHGGLVIAMMVRAATLDSNLRPASVTAHLHSGAQSGPARIELLELNAGRTARSMQAVLEQDRRRATAVVLLTSDEAADATGAEIPPSAVGPLPPLPADVDEAAPSRRIAPFMDNLHVAMVGDNFPFRGGSDTALAAWMRPRRPHPDPAAIATLLLDAMPPSLYARRTAPQPILTIEFTVHLTPLAHRPARGDGWLLIEQRTVWAIGELCMDDATLRDEAGDLIGSARQLRRVLPPR